MIQKFLRSNFIKLSKYFAEFLLVSEGSEEWLKIKTLRKAWHYLVLTVLAKFFYGYLFIGLIAPQFGQSVTIVYVHRYILLILSIILLFLTLFILYTHYRYLFSTGLDLRFKNIPLFYFLIVAIYSHLYLSIYFIDPALFNYPFSYYIPTEFYNAIGFKNYLLMTDFFVYSSSVSFSLSYPRISSSSILISVLNVSQVIINVIIVSLFVSTFVQKISNKN